MVDHGSITHKLIKLNHTPEPEVLTNICNLLNLKLKDMTIEEYALGCLGEDFREAVRRAKSARFEHGECALVIG